jgi:hypothetical protein
MKRPRTRLAGINLRDYEWEPLPPKPTKKKREYTKEEKLNAEE